MTGDGPTRRDLLRAGGLAATTVLGGLAGCTGPRLERRVGGDRARTGYRRWLPSRATLGLDAGAGYRFVTMDVGAALDNDDRLSPVTVTAVRGIFDGDLLPAADDVDLLVSVQTEGGGGLVAIEGSFPAGDLSGAIVEDDYSRETTYAGYEVFTRDAGGAIGLADGVLLASGVDDPVEGLRGAIDASEGQGESITDASDDADALVSTLGEGLFANGGVPAGGVSSGLRSDALAANGLRGRVDGEATDVRQVLVYDRAGDVDTTAIRGVSGTAAALDDVGVRRSGRTALVDGSLPTDELRPRDLFGVAIQREADETGERASHGGIGGEPSLSWNSTGAEFRHGLRFAPIVSRNL